MNPYLRKCNATNLFILPLLKMDRGNLLRLGMVGVFIKDEIGELEFEGCIHVVFKPANLQDFNLFTEEYRDKIVDEYDHHGYVVLTFKFPEKFQKDVDTIMLGKFSKTSKDYQNAITMYTKQTGKDGILVDELTIQHKIFQKDEEVKNYWKEEYGLVFEREDEVWPMYKEREVFNKHTLDRIKQNL